MSDVLDTLVRQFTDPLACLRELIQNAIDAGSDLVEVRCFRDGEHGVLEVQDHGEGMDASIIEKRLVRLFASTKDGDLTKIGKFGVGFVSVFALNPEAVCVDTAKGGERWRVVFKPDRTWTRARLDEPLEGTRVRLYVKKNATEVETLRTDAHEAVKRWCRFVGVEILFDDTPINEPLHLPGHALTITDDDQEGTALVLGIGPGHTAGGSIKPSTTKHLIGFYNKGLTLLETNAWDDITPGVSALISSRWLEHTITRDSIVRDGHYHKAIKRLRGLIDTKLVPAAVARAAGGSLGGERGDGPHGGESAPLDDVELSVRWAALHFLSTRASDKAVRTADCLLDAGGTLHRPDKLKRETVHYAVVSSPTHLPLATAMSAAGAPVFLVRGGLRTKDDVAALAALLRRDVDNIKNVEADAVIASPVDAARAPRADRLCEAINAIAKGSGLKFAVSPVLLGGRAAARTMMVEGKAPKAPAPVRLTSSSSSSLSGAKLLHVAHKEVEPFFELAARDTDLAAGLLLRRLLPVPMSADLDGRLLDATWSARQARERSAGGRP